MDLPGRRQSTIRSAVGALALLAAASTAAAQPPPAPLPAPPPPPAPQPVAAPPVDFTGALQTLRAPGSPGGAGGPGMPGKGIEIFPDAGRVWMSVREVDPLPIEKARRNGTWLCGGGQCSVGQAEPNPSKVGDEILRSIKLSTATLPLPLTIWGRTGSNGERILDFDPVLIGRRSYAHVCAYRPIDPGKPEKVLICRDGTPETPTFDSGELLLGMQWPRSSELAEFKYLAIVDACGNARVQRFQRHFTVPVTEATTGSCGPADGRVLRVFPQGGFVRVTAFNLDAPAAGGVISATYRVSIPALENMVESTPARLLFPDPSPSDLQIDCGPGLPKAPAGAPSAAPPPRQGPTFVDPDAPEKPADRPAPSPVADRPATGTGRGPGPQPLSHGGAMIAPEPLRQGNCKIRLMGQTKRRLVAPLALHVSLMRTDRSVNGGPVELIRDGAWIVTPDSPEFAIPALADGFDGESRLKLVVSSDPLSNHGKVVLLSDASRVASARSSGDPGEPDRARRPIGTLVIHSAPLCGQSNFESLDSKGSCFRAYITIPAILGMIQLTRAPWLEKPLITRNVLSAVGAALAFDAYDPVARKAFPIAAQVGGLFENLGDGKLGVLGYVGVAPTIPVLGEGGNTTSIGFLGGLGLAYVINEKGPDEGVKPAAFLSVLVSVGQASPWVRSGR